MRRFIPARLTQLTWVLVIGCVAFMMALSIVGNEIATRVENYIGIALAVACLVKYRHASVQAILSKLPTNVQVLSLGIFVAWFGNIIRNVYSSLDRDFGISWIRLGPYVPMFLFMFLLSGMLHIAAPHVKDGKISGETWLELAIVVASGTIVAMAVTVYVAYYRATV